MGKHESLAIQPSSLNVGFDAIKAAEYEGPKHKVAEATIPTNYIPEPQLRIDTYRHLAMAASIKEVDEIAASLEDRFGKLPKSLQILMLVTKVRVSSENADIVSVETTGSRLKCSFADKKRFKDTHYISLF